MKIEPGQIVLIPMCRPPLAADTYDVTVKQTLAGGKKASVDVDSGLVDVALGLPEETTQKIKVAGPRFILTPDEVHSMFPPVNNLGNFANRLPQIVLRRRTLPWERKIYSGQDDYPWMALLLVTEEEEAKQEGGDKLVEFHPQKLVSELLLSSDTTIHKPDLDHLTDEEKDRSCMMVDMNANLFAAICPTAEEMALLSHVRVVSTKDKELLGQDEDGWFSVVTCNRLPTQGIQQKHRAMLVSLEGHRDNMFRISGRTRPGKVRMVVLAQWQFTSKESGDFKTTLTNIGRSGGVGLLGDGRDNCVPISKDSIDVPIGEDSTDRNHLVIETAHVPLNQAYRTGEKGVGLYRGPLTPSPISHESMVCNHVDETMVIDPTTGLEQIGYSAAFELGRLLGASDQGLAVGLLKWRRGDYYDAQGVANIKDLLVQEDWQLNFDGRDIRMEHIPLLEELKNPLGPLVNPPHERGYFSKQSHVIDQGGMSQTFMAEMGDKMTTDIGTIGKMDMGDVNAGLENIGDVFATPGGGHRVVNEVGSSMAELIDQSSFMENQLRDKFIVQVKGMGGEHK